MDGEIIYRPSEYVDFELTGRVFSPDELTLASFVAGTLRLNSIKLLFLLFRQQEVQKKMKAMLHVTKKIILRCRVGTGVVGEDVGSAYRKKENPKTIAGEGSFLLNKKKQDILSGNIILMSGKFVLGK